LGRWVSLGAVAGALALAGPATAANVQELTITVSDGTQLACALAEPDGAPPAGGWPGLILFHGLGGKHQDMEPLAIQALADGYASVMCDARGHGASGGQFGLAGPTDVQDARELYVWLAARPEVSDTQIGALGISLGGGTVWNAAAAGVPFKAIVPIITWVDLQRALAPQGLPKSGLVLLLSQLVPLDRWQPDLLAGKNALLAGDTTALAQLNAIHSSIAKLPSLSVPTLLLQGRHDFLFDIDQALTAYGMLTGPKLLYLGDLGHPPAANPVAEQPYYDSLALKWFDRFLKGMANGVDKQHVVLAHDPWDGVATSYAAPPPTKTTSVTLPGTNTIEQGGRVVRGARITGGPHETFGDTTITVRYSGAKGWDRLVAVLTLAGSSTPISAGGVKLTGSAGVASIKLMNESVLVPAGKRLTVYLGATSLVQDPGDALYIGDVQPGSSITIGRETVKLSVLTRAVSR
jgi:pimeloyl-ACP methyl ester carboxylesterase